MGFLGIDSPRFDGETYLAYKTWPLHVALLRGTTADLDGRLDGLR